MKLVTTEDAQLRCEHSPRPGAPALLLLNPLGTSLEVWDDQFQPLCERYELVRFDARGHGESTTGSKSELTMEQLARDALAVLDACGIARAHLCGLSVGGMTAMQVATLWPDRVLKIALCSTSPYLPSRETWNTRIETVRKQGMAPLVDGILQRWFTTPYRTAHPEQAERIRAMLLAAKPAGLRSLRGGHSRHGSAAIDQDDHGQDAGGRRYAGSGHDARGSRADRRVDSRGAARDARSRALIAHRAPTRIHGNVAAVSGSIEIRTISTRGAP